MLAAVAFRGIGCGYSAVKDWCGNKAIIHCQNRRAYQKTCEQVGLASQKVVQKVRDKYVKTLFKEYEGLFSWVMVRRGHSSHNGLDSVIDLLTGSPLHFHVLSHFYPKCK